VVGEIAIFAGVLVVAAVLAVWLIRREDVHLRRESQRYRELRLEGIEELRRPGHGDPYPEEPSGGSRWMREPDGRVADADRVLYEELERARRHTRQARSARSRRRSVSRAKGTECLL
jgi:hypothetical protein